MVHTADNLKKTGLAKSRDKLWASPQGGSTGGYYFSFSVSAHRLKEGLPQAPQLINSRVAHGPCDHERASSSHCQHVNPVVCPLCTWMLSISDAKCLFLIFVFQRDENLPCAKAKLCSSGLQGENVPPCFSLNVRTKQKSMMPNTLACQNHTKTPLQHGTWI